MDEKFKRDNYHLKMHGKQKNCMGLIDYRKEKFRKLLNRFFFSNILTNMWLEYQTEILKLIYDEVGSIIEEKERRNDLLVKFLFPLKLLWTK